MTKLVTLPTEIEKASFDIITNELGNINLDPVTAPIIKRVIHTTADFEYARSLYFSDDAISSAIKALKKGCTIVTDTNMARVGINNSSLKKLGCKVCCFISDPDVEEIARHNQSTRAVAAMEKATTLKEPIIFVVGNAPTALIRLSQLIKGKKVAPALVVAAPVGFVNILESKQDIMSCDVPMIVSQGRKGGSNVAAAIINALMLMC